MDVAVCSWLSLISVTTAGAQEAAPATNTYRRVTASTLIYADAHLRIARDTTTYTGPMNTITQVVER
jgi:hypothetical protein